MEAKVSVITVCRNARQKLEDTIKSVLSQEYKNIEYIVIDGLSTDGTDETIRKYEKSLTYWISERDRGIADAFNKGFLVSKGEWIAYLNAGDAYYDRKAISALISNSEDFDIVYGNLEVKRKNKQQSTYYYAEDVKKDTYWLKNAIPHQSCLVARRVFEKIGLFDENLKFAMDYEHFLRAYKHNFKFKAVNTIITEVNNNGVSARFWREQLQEFLSAQKKYNLAPFLRYFYHLERFLRNYAYHKLGRF